ncbi:hypothetical protein Tco_1161594, partial [Tanacetum coccineum]
YEDTWIRRIGHKVFMASWEVEAQIRRIFLMDMAYRVSGQGANCSNSEATDMKIALHARNKMGFEDGSCVKSAYETSAPLTNQWKRCNDVFLSWLLSSISEDLYLSQVYYENAAEVWKYYKQNGLPVSEYYHKLNSLWREFDTLTKLTPCSCDVKAELGKHNQLMKLMQTLIGLDEVYQPIRSSLLTQTKLPDVKDTFVIVCREESHRGLGYTFGVQKLHVSSFVAGTLWEWVKVGCNTQWDQVGSCPRGHILLEIKIEMKRKRK